VSKEYLEEMIRELRLTIMSLEARVKMLEKSLQDDHR
jgi:hypothetical protein